MSCDIPDADRAWLAAETARRRREEKRRGQLDQWLKRVGLAIESAVRDGREVVELFLSNDEWEQVQVLDLQSELEGLGYSVQLGEQFGKTSPGYGIGGRVGYYIRVSWEKT